jgi:hypothetical protein
LMGRFTLKVTYIASISRVAEYTSCWNSYCTHTGVLFWCGRKSEGPILEGKSRNQKKVLTWVILYWNELGLQITTCCRILY